MVHRVSSNGETTNLVSKRLYVVGERVRELEERR